MIITDTIAKDLLLATKSKDNEKIQALRLIIGSYTSYADKKDQITLSNIVAILNKLINGEQKKLLFEKGYITDNELTKIRTNYTGNKVQTEIDKLIELRLKENKHQLRNRYIEIWEEYLPNTPSKEIVISWIKSNIDPSKYKNILSAMKDISTQFPFNNKEELKIELLNYKQEYDNKINEPKIDIPDVTVEEVVDTEEMTVESKIIFNEKQNEISEEWSINNDNNHTENE